MAFFPSDWIAGTASMTRMHRSIYFDICCYIWDKATPVPASKLPLMLGDIPNWRELLGELVAGESLILNEDGSISNVRAEIEAAKALSLYEKKARGGRTQAAVNNSTPDSTPAQHSCQDTSKTAVTEPEPEPEEPNGSITPLPPLDGLPAWLPREQWQAFLDMRKAIKAVPTDHAVTLLIAKLDRLRNEGHDPGAVLDQSTLSNWRGVFPLKEDHNGSTKAGGYSAHDRRDGVAKALDRRLGLDDPAGAAGRPDAGEGGGNRPIPITDARRLR